MGSKCSFGGRGRLGERADGLHSACLKNVGRCSLSLDDIYFVNGVLVTTLNELFNKDSCDDIELNKFLIVQADAG